MGPFHCIYNEDCTQQNLFWLALVLLQMPTISLKCEEEQNYVIGTFQITNGFKIPYFVQKLGSCKVEDPK